MDEGIGAAVRAARLRRGKSLDVVAQLAGHSKSWLSKVERGLLPLQRRSDITALADALQVSPADLTGQPYRLAEPGTSTMSAAIRGVRVALLDVPPRSVTPTEVLRGELDTLTRQRQACQLHEAAGTAARLLPALRAVRASGDRQTTPDALRLLVWTCFETASLARELGYPDLTLLLAGLIDEAAAELADPTWLAVAALVRTHTLSSVATAAFGAAVEVGTAAAEAVRPLSGGEALAGYGCLLLATGFALSAAGRGDEATDRLTEAARVADRLAEPTDIARHLAFGGPGVGLHRLSVSMELGDPDAAVTAAGQVQPEQLPYPARRASYWSDLGRAHAALGHDGEAVACLRRAEEIAPLRVRLHPLVREAVVGMVGRAQRAAVGRDLRGLAYRMGLPH
jgi:transcriptional regulator with XRE-family HTH domain